MDIDVTRLIGAVQREVLDEERGGETVRVVRVTRTFDTTVEDLWNAVTDPDRIPRWFLPVTGDLRVGGRYQLEGNAGGEITTCDPPEHLAVTWEFGGGMSWVDVRLGPDGEQARLELSHAVVLDPHWDQFGPGAVGIGWELGLMGLDLHLASGAALDAAEVMAWQATPQGGELMVGSSEGWCRADIANGAPEDEAQAMAARTLAAYTGEG